MESFVYIISCQRGQGLPEIRSVWTDYDDAIVAYCENLEDWNNQDFYLFHKLPVGRFCEPGEWCKEKLGKSSKNRLKFDEKELNRMRDSILLSRRRAAKLDKIID
jgi:hypothetical protein